MATECIDAIQEPLKADWNLSGSPSAGASNASAAAIAESTE
jgi:hypothetical protein